MGINTYKLVVTTSDDKWNLDKWAEEIDKLKDAKAEIKRGNMSLLIKSKLLNALDEEIEHIKNKMKALIDAM